MKARRTMVLAVMALLAWSPSPAAAQEVLIVDAIRLGTAPCLVRTGSGTPTGGNTCDTYLDTATGNLWTKASGVWAKVNTYGTVTSVTVTVPSFLQGSGCTITTSGTCAISLQTQSPNRFFAGPVNGSAAAPTFRTLVLEDFPMATADRFLASTGGTSAPVYRVLALADLPTDSAGKVLASTGGTSAYTATPTVTSLTSVSLLASANLTISPSGDLVLDPVGNDVVPNTNYDINLGALTNRYLSLHAAELWVETLVAQETMATIGGRILVGPTTQLTADLSSGAVTMQVKHNQLASGDTVYLEENGALEAMLVTSGASGGGPYTYSIVRDRDGSGANAWTAGAAVFNTGATGDGFIDLYSVSGVLYGAGPTIVGKVRTGSTFSQVEPRWAIGNLNGVYGYATDTYGAAFGDNAQHWLKIDASGIRIGHNATTLIDISGGSATFTGSIASTSGFIGGFGIGGDYVRDAANSFGLASTVTGGDDVRFWAGDTFANRGTAPFRVTEAGAVVMNSATISGPDLTLGTPGSYTSSSALKFTRPTANGFGQSGDHFGAYTTTSGSNDFLYIENTMAGNTTSSGRADVTVKATGWSNSPGPGSGTEPVFLALRSDVGTQSATLQAGTGIDIQTTGVGAEIVITAALVRLPTKAYVDVQTGGTPWASAAWQVRPGTNQNLAVSGPITLADGVALHSFNDAVSANRGMELRATNMLFETGTLGIGTGATATHLLELGADDAYKPSTSTWGILSDRRAKQNIHPLTGGLAAIRRLPIQIAEYNGQFGTRKGARVVGPLAQDAQKVFPQSVTTVGGVLTWNAHETLMTGIVAIQELDSIVAAQAKTISALESRIKTLEKKK